jgi:DNA-binding transcriptional ArsR family regulator
MSIRDDIGIASVIGDPARALMLWSLLDGQARPAGELAFYANVSAQSASNHLAKLVKAKMLSVEPRGRHRYYRLAGADIAEAVEAIVTLGNLPGKGSEDLRAQTPELKFARSCYDHLAGKLAVAITQRMEEKNLLVRSDHNFDVTESGQHWLKDLGIEVANVRQKRRKFARQCLDWSERRHHLAGALGAALFDRMLSLGWLARTRAPRVIRLTLDGRKSAERLLGITV